MKIAFPINRGEKIARHVSFCPSFLMIETETGEREIVDNPMKIEGAAVDLKKDKSEGRRLGTGRIISQLFAEKEVDLYVYLEADANFLLHLQNVGIYVYESQEKVIEVALKTVEVNLKEFFNFAQRGVKALDEERIEIVVSVMEGEELMVKNEVLAEVIE